MALGSMRMFLHLCLQSCCVLLILEVGAAGAEKTTRDVLREISKHADYRVRPYDDEGQTLNVSISMYIINIRGISEQRQEFGLELYFRKTWNDPRLLYTEGPDYILLTPDIATKMIWLPDVFFSNAHHTSVQEYIKPLYGVKLMKGGDVHFSVKMSLTVQCPMNLRSFPFDTQVCALDIETYMTSNQDINLQFLHDRAVTHADGIFDSEFKLKGVEAKQSVTVLSTGSFSRLTAEFTLERLSGHYVLILYAPTFLLVVLSCLLFWMPLTALLERTLLGGLLLVSLVPFCLLSQYCTPQVGYPKATDLWVIACFVFLVVAIFEVVILHLLQRTEQNGGTPRGTQFELMKEDDASTRSDNSANHHTSPEFIRPGVLHRCDVILRFLYPAAFVLFNIVYWCVYR